VDKDQLLGPAVNRPGRLITDRPRNVSIGAVQLLYMAAGVALGLAMAAIDSGPTTDAGPVRAMVIAVGVGVIPFIAIVYSLLFLVVQFGITTYTARLNLFRDSPITWNSFGYYVAMVTYCLTAAIAVESADEVTLLLPISVAVLLLVALGVFVLLQQAASRAIQLSATLEEVERRGRSVIAGIYPDPAGSPGAPQWSPPPGEQGREVRWVRGAALLQAIDVRRLLEVATKHSAVIEIRIKIGELVHEGSVIAVVYGGDDAFPDAAILRSIRIGHERTFGQDPGLAFRALTDIALRALSPAVNDPTTAAQALNISEILLRMLASRELDVGRIAGTDGAVRVVLHFPDWEDYVSVATDEVIHYGATSPQVSSRLERLLTDLALGVREDQREALSDRLARLRRVEQAALV
jgi:uncharacterized membrane protein